MNDARAHIVIDALNLSMGGGAIVVCRISDAFVRRGHTVTVLTSRDGVLATSKEVLARSLVFPEAVGAQNAQLFRYRRLPRLLRDLNPDGLVSFNYYTPWSGRQVCYHINVISYLPFAQRRKAVGLLRAILHPRAARRALRKCDANLFESQHLLDLARPDGARAGTDFVAYTGVDLPPAGPVGRAVPPSPPVVVLVTSAAPYKRNDVALRAFREFSYSEPRAELIVLGNAAAIQAQLPDDLQAYCEGNEKVVFRGYVSQIELQETLGNAFALLTASELESFYMVAVEAMAMGCPVVVADSSSARESVGVAGMLFAPGDWRQAAEALLALRCAPDWPKASLVSLEWAKRFDDEALADRFVDVTLPFLAGPRS